MISAKYIGSEGSRAFDPSHKNGEVYEFTQDQWNELYATGRAEHYVFVPAKKSAKKVTKMDKAQVTVADDLDQPKKESVFARVRSRKSKK